MLNQGSTAGTFTMANGSNSNYSPPTRATAGREGSFVGTGESVDPSFGTLGAGIPALGYRPNESAQWALMGILPQPQNVARRSESSHLNSFCGGASSLPYVAGEEIFFRDQQCNSAICQVQVQDSMDMITSIVAKEQQAMLKINVGPSRVDHRLGSLGLSHHQHPQVIVNGARENLSSSPSDMSPTSCSPSSSDTMHSGRPLSMRPHDGGGGGGPHVHRHNGDNGAARFVDSPIDVTGLINSHALKQEPHFDMSGILGMGQLNGHLQNPSVNANTSNDHVLSSPTSLGSFGGLSYPPPQQQLHSNGSSSSAQSQMQSPPEVRPSSASNITRSRHRSSQHDGLIKCHYCPKKFADQSALRLHMEECRVLRMHECQQCGKRFKARGGLQQHMRIHSNDRPYQCRFCPKRFTQKSHVDQHERIHTGVKPFSCQFCGRAFRQRSQQIGHEATHGNGGLSVAANIASQQQQLHLASESSFNSPSEGRAPTSPDGSASASHGRPQQLSGCQGSSNEHGMGGGGSTLMPVAGNQMVAHNAVSSLLALSQGGREMCMQGQTLSGSLVNRAPDA